MGGLDNDYIDLVVTSPPYDNLRDYNGFSFDFYNTAIQLYRVIKQGGVLVWIVSDQTINGSETGTSFKQALNFIEIGFNLHDTMVWSKDTTSYPDSNRYYNTFEYMFILSKGKPKTFNPIKDRKNKYSGHKVHGTSRLPSGETYRKSNDMKTTIPDYGSRFNVWQIPTEKNSKKYNHPAMMPIQLAKDHILSWSNKGDLVFDPFIGSGTVGVASIQLSREFIGCDISKEYCEIARNRIQNESQRIIQF